MGLHDVGDVFAADNTSRFANRTKTTVAQTAGRYFYVISGGVCCDAETVFSKTVEFTHNAWQIEPTEINDGVKNAYSSSISKKSQKGDEIQKVVNGIIDSFKWLIFYDTILLTMPITDGEHGLNHTK